jgi:hypothetical protein
VRRLPLRFSFKSRPTSFSRPLIPSSIVALLAKAATMKAANIGKAKSARSIRRIPKTTLGVLALLVAVAAVVAVVQPSPTTWHDISLPSSLSSTLGSLQGVGCTPQGTCVLAGSTDYAVASQPSGAWAPGPFQELDNSIAEFGGSSSIGDTSCGATTCIVTGLDQLATVGRDSSLPTTFSGVVGTRLGPISGFASVWCGSGGLCVATRVDGSESTGESGRYNYPDELATSSDGGHRWTMHTFGHVLDGWDVVACESARFCLFTTTQSVALEAGTDTGADLHPVAVEHEPASAENIGDGAISCTTARCLLGYGDGWIAVVSDLGRHWSWHRAIPRVDWGLGTWISNIACATAMDCIATVPTTQAACGGACLGLYSPSMIVATVDGGETWHLESIPSDFTLPDGGPTPIGCSRTRCYVIGFVGDTATLATATPW